VTDADTRPDATALDAGASDARSPTRTLRAALGTIVAASAAPYGYTISIWSSGAALHWLAAGAAVGAAALLAEIHAWEAWPLGSFAATSIYILGAGAQLAVVSARRTSSAR
jgi:hypothetical protein